MRFLISAKQILFHYTFRNQTVEGVNILANVAMIALDRKDCNVIFEHAFGSAPCQITACAG
ncbi:hypothetical protein Nit79A3_1510 [Nitrosomonas sp. Is79A3]